MIITLTDDYYASVDSHLLGYMGEKESRVIKAENLECEGAEFYKIRFTYDDKVQYEADITDGEYTVQGALLRKVGLVDMQILAVKSDGSEYEYVKKSNIFKGEIRESDGSIAPIPTYDESVAALDRLVEYDSESKANAEAAEESAKKASNSATAAASAEAGAGHYAKDAGSKSVAAAESARIAKEAQDVVVPASEAAIKASEDAAESARRASLAATNSMAFNDAVQQAASQISEWKTDIDGKYDTIVMSAAEVSTDTQKAIVASVSAENSAESASKSESVVKSAEKTVATVRDEVTRTASEVDSNRLKAQQAASNAQGSANAAISAKDTAVSAAERAEDAADKFVIDTELSSTSNNAIANKTVTENISRVSESIVEISDAIIDGTDIRYNIPVTLTQGRYYYSANAITYDKSTKFIRSELIDISGFDNITFYVPSGYEMLAHAFDSDSGNEYNVVKNYISSWTTGEQTLSFSKKDGANYLMFELKKVDSSAFTPSSVTDTLLFSKRKTFIKRDINEVGAYAYLSGGNAFSFEEYIKANDTWIKTIFPSVGTLYIKGYDRTNIITVPCSAQEFTVAYNSILVVDANSGIVTVKTASDMNETDIGLLYVFGGYVHGLIANQYYNWKNSLIGVDSVPSYYVSHLMEKITTINDISANIGMNGDSFVFITDTHDNKNTGNSPILIKQICRSTGVDKVFHGGDIINSEASKTAVYDKVGAYLGQFHDSSFDFYPTAGNHEYNNPDAGTSADEVALQLTADNIYPFIAHGLNWKIKGMNGLAYCVDNNISKIRYVVVSCGYDSNIPSDIKQSAIDMINSTLDDYGVVVISHVGVTSTGINPSATGIINALDNLTGAYPIAFINGHCHRDEKTVSSGGVPIISTTTDAYASDRVYTRTKGTITEQAFDVVQIDKINRKIYMTRIGAGSDRVFDF